MLAPVGPPRSIREDWQDQYQLCRRSVQPSDNIRVGVDVLGRDSREAAILTGVDGVRGTARQSTEPVLAQGFRP